METHHYHHDMGLTIHMFSMTLEGDAMSWFLSLTKEQVQDLNIIATLFIKRFTHLKETKPTWSELNSEKKKSGETFLKYVARWRSMLIKSELPVLEKQAVQVLVNNADGPIQTALIYSPTSTFDELIERVTHLQQNEDKLNIQTASPATRGRKAAIVEGISAIDNQQNRNSNRRQWNNNNNNNRGQYKQPPYQYPPQQQQVANIQQPARQQTYVPPPQQHAYVPQQQQSADNKIIECPPPQSFGQKQPFKGRRETYHALHVPYLTIFTIMKEANEVEYPTVKDEPPHVNKGKYCEFHRMHGHTTGDCFTLRDYIYDLNDRGIIDWERARQQLKGKSMEIHSNPLPAHNVSTLDAYQPMEELCMFQSHNHEASTSSPANTNQPTYLTNGATPFYLGDGMKFPTWHWIPANGATPPAWQQPSSTLPFADAATVDYSVAPVTSNMQQFNQPAVMPTKGILYKEPRAIYNYARQGHFCK